MKKLCVFAAAIVAVTVGVAVWFSPLALSHAQRYENNAAVFDIEGFCYPEDTTVRADYVGSKTDMYAALSRMLARPVAAAHSGGTLIVYAYSPRVAGKVRTLASGERYNVMAAYRDGVYCVGTPVLQGSF